MKAMLCGLVLLLGITFGAGAGEFKFIISTASTDFGNGISSAPGEVEQVISETPSGYTIEYKGKRYVIPKGNAQPITSELAVVALLAQRERMYSQLVAAVDALESKEQTPQPPRPTQYNGRPLPRNWIDPKQADANFFNQQLINELRRIQSLPR